MCTSIYFEDEGIHVSTVRQLADYIKTEPVNMVWREGDPIRYVDDPHGRNFVWCLCPLNIEATLEHCGYSGDWSDDGDLMGFVARRRS